MTCRNLEHNHSYLLGRFQGLASYKQHGLGRAKVSEFEKLNDHVEQMLADHRAGLGCEKVAA